VSPASVFVPRAKADLSLLVEVPRGRESIPSTPTSIVSRRRVASSTCSSSHTLAENADYGENFAEKTIDQLMNMGIAKSHLGTTKSVSASNSQDFGRQIGRYVDSKEKELGKRKKGDRKGPSPKKLSAEEKQQ
jgi:hypothetical protein